jgi:hypothetical protein
MSAVVFSVPLAAQLSALLLYHGPRAEWLWFLSIRLNRLSAPAFQLLNDWFPDRPLPLGASFAILCAALGLSQARRSWLGAFILGHLALLVCVFSAASQLKRVPIDVNYDSLGRLAGAVANDWNTALLTAAALAFLVVCPVNHSLYLRGRSALHSDHPGSDSHLRSGRCVCSYSMVLCYLARCCRAAAYFLTKRRSSVEQPLRASVGASRSSAVR